MDEQLLELIARGHILARIADVDYIGVHLVFAWPRSGEVAPYCMEADWPETLPGRLDTALREHAELAEAFSLQAAEALKQAQRAAAAEARVAELEKLIVETPITPAVAAAATGMPKQSYAPPSDGGRSKRIECAICKALVWPKLFDAHMAKHTRIEAPTPAPAEPEPPAAPTIRLLDDDPTWRCAEIGCSGAFTRSLTSPEYCVKHAPITNGQHLAAA